MAPKIRVGVVGYGGSAKNFHIPFISAIPDYEIIAILQRAEVPTGEVASGTHCKIDHPTVRHYRTSEEFFGDADIDFVVVATRGDTHTLFAEKALEAGKHGKSNGFVVRDCVIVRWPRLELELTIFPSYLVIVDKPFSHSSEEADRVIQLAEKQGKIVTCFQNRRWVCDCYSPAHRSEWALTANCRMEASRHSVVSWTRMHWVR